MAGHEEARQLQHQAETFERQGNDHAAADLYQQAAKEYRSSGDSYLSNYCLGKNFVRRAFATVNDDPGAAIVLFEQGIEAWNSALSTIRPDTQRYVFTLGNIRYIESIRFARDAQLKEALSKREEDRTEQVMQLARASADSLSAAHAKYDSAQLGREMLNLPVYYNRMGSYHHNRSECYRYLATIQEMLLYIRYGMTLLRDSVKEVTRGAEFFDKSLKLAPLPATKTNLHMLRSAAEEREDDFHRMKGKLPFDRQPPDTRGMPRVKFTLTSGLDLMENLYSPVLLILENAGEVWARDLQFKLHGDFSGEKEATLESLPPKSEQLLSLSMAPDSAGPMRLKATLEFKSSAGKSYRIEDEKHIPVLSFRQKRGTGGMLINSSYLDQKRTDAGTNTSKKRRSAEGIGSVAKITCPHCRRSVTQHKNQCPHCGMELIARCPQCKTELPLQWDMCSRCGKWNIEKRERRAGMR